MFIVLSELRLSMVSCVGFSSSASGSVLDVNLGFLSILFIVEYQFL